MKLRKTLRIDLPSNITIEADNRSSFRCRSSRRRQVRLIVALDGSRESKAVLHPKNFAINEAWIL
ncbi:MAG: hypothetical protein KDA57_24235, partial [Planctomycetales bacterium]|nr:hypothetical protein [Planctomycetales bacterium]